MSSSKRLHVSYTKTNPENLEVYSGRASGIDDGSLKEEELAEKIMAKRDSSHHKNEDGFDVYDIDKISNNYEAIRGREQMLIEYNGGAKSKGGTSGNSINSISDRNPKKKKYLLTALKIFGSITSLIAVFWLFTGL
ncbi:MAG: hypothetical protein H7A25_04790 [Leptospiraceae bacterium]|nr:hypothetical protein [Leptospiraceae bacterium]